MARILAYTSPARGHLYPLTPILDELQQRGHRVAVRTLSSEIAIMRERGFDASPISTQVESIKMDDWRGKGPRDSLATAVACFCARAEYDAADLRQAIGDEQPDALLVDINSWGALAEAERWGGPWAAFCPYPLALSSPDVPPFGPGLAPAHGPLGHLRDAVLGKLVMSSITKIIVPAVNQVRVSEGLAPLSRPDDMFLRPPLLLYMTAEPFEYHRRHWPGTVVMIGPCAWEPPSTPPAWLDTIDRPIVLVTTSSEYQNDVRLVETALQALADEPVHVVATLPAGDPDRLDVPANARVERYVPHGAILDRAICAITHGGMGGTQKALARGVPVCAVPFGRDQAEVARRVEVSGAGVRLPASRLTPERLREAVRKAIDCRDGARRVAAGFAATGGPVAAVDALESRVLASHPAVSSEILGTRR